MKPLQPSIPCVHTLYLFKLSIIEIDLFALKIECWSNHKLYSFYRSGSSVILSPNAFANRHAFEPRWKHEVEVGGCCSPKYFDGDMPPRSRKQHSFKIKLT